MSASKLCLLVSGPYGGFNLGDDAIAKVICQQFAQRGFEVVLAVGDIDRASAIFKNIPLVERFDLRSGRFGMVQAIKQCDFIIVGGGEQISESRFPNPFWGHLATNLQICYLGYRYKKPSALLAVGVSSNISLLGRFLIARSFSKLAYISVRDCDSRKLLSKVVKDNCSINLGADPAFLMGHFPRTEGRNWLARKYEIETGHPLVLFILSNDKFHNLEYLAAVNKVINKLVGRSFQILYAVSDLQESYDIRLHSESMLHTSAKAVWMKPGDGGLDGLCKAISGADCVVSTRMHPLIFSMIQRTPFLCLARSTKMRALMKMLGSSYIDLDKLTSENLQAAILHRLTIGREEFYQPLDHKIELLKQRARIQFDDVCNILNVSR